MRLLKHSNSPIRGERGSALITSLITVSVLTGAAVAMLTASVAVTNKTNSTVTRARALHLAEAGVNAALVEVASAVVAGGLPAANVGTQAAPRRMGSGRYWADILNLGDGNFEITSTGRAQLLRRRLSAVVVPRSGVFSYAVFAGNESDDPAYSIRFAGAGSQADLVDGNVYSGGSANMEDDAVVTGDIEVTDAVTGALGTTGIQRPSPNLVGMNYPSTADFNVASLFVGAAPGSFAASGTALQVPESNPAHIFRKNPDDRTSLTGGTVKEDYFLEDPYQPISSFTLRGAGSPGHAITLTGVDGAPGASGTDAVYYIDGNLWLNNLEVLGSRFDSTPGQPAKLTFAVSGNIYFSDDLELEDVASDGVAFIALKDPMVADSGNIYFGDSTFATISRMEAFMYAENNFYDNNLVTSASDSVTVVGTMAAGNHVSIVSDWTDATGAPQHSRLEVTGDDRLTTGALTLPGIPGFGPGTLGYQVVHWRELSPQ